jgi:hypothetical protein
LNYYILVGEYVCFKVMFESLCELNFVSFVVMIN